MTRFLKARLFNGRNLERTLIENDLDGHLVNSKYD